jgi:endonuclease YncB( thermonuclease family)
MGDNAGVMLASLTLIFLLLVPGPLLGDVAGPASVVDGDTIEIAGERIRLYGIDAPEVDQMCHTRRGKPYPCGAIAIEVLAKLIAGQPLACSDATRDSAGRLVAVCRVGRIDIGEQMVIAGWALAARHESGAYVRAERAARSVPDGMWKGRFEAPWDWRTSRREAPHGGNADGDKR